MHAWKDTHTYHSGINVVLFFFTSSENSSSTTLDIKVIGVCSIYLAFSTYSTENVFKVGFNVRDENAAYIRTIKKNKYEHLAHNFVLLLRIL
jgi:hypothetical protein